MWLGFLLRFCRTLRRLSEGRDTLFLGLAVFGEPVIAFEVVIEVLNLDTFFGSIGDFGGPNVVAHQLKLSSFLFICKIVCR